MSAALDLHRFRIRSRFDVPSFLRLNFRQGFFLVQVIYLTLFFNSRRQRMALAVPETRLVFLLV